MAYKEVVVKKPLSLIILPYVSLILFFGIWQASCSSASFPILCWPRPPRY